MKNKRVLITGKRGYLARHLQQYLLEKHPQWTVETVSVRKQLPQDLMSYDTVVHAAALVHQSRKHVPLQHYLDVNTELTTRLAEECQNKWIRHFVFISTMAVYSSKETVITDSTVENPDTSYGKSKWEAEKNLMALEDYEDRPMPIAIVRPPMVYGRGCPGNYAKLKVLSQFTPIFPYIENKRSMISIAGLCQALDSIICTEADGIFHPQDSEYGCTSRMVEAMRRQEGRSTYLCPFLGKIVSAVPLPVFKKMFGDFVYDVEEGV